VSKRDGYDYDGYKLRVEFPKGGGRSDGFDRRGGGGGRGGFGRDGRSGGGGSRQQTTRRSQYRVLISGMLHFLLFITKEALGPYFSTQNYKLRIGQESFILEDGRESHVSVG